MRSNFNDYTELFAKYMRSEKRSENTIKCYLGDLRQVGKLASLYNANIEDIDQTIIEKIKGEFFGRGLSVKTVNRKLISINRYLQYVTHNSDIPVRTDIKIEFAKFQHQEYLEDMMTVADFKRLVRFAERENDYRAIGVFYTLFMTGMRVSEMLQLRLEDVKENIVSVKGKGTKYRNVFIPIKLKKYWARYLRIRDNTDDEALFTGPCGPMNRQTVHRIIKKYAGRARVKLKKAHAHNFRHLFALEMLRNGLSISEVADLLGHSDINITRIYTRKTKKQLLKAINKM
jgi:integrase/recombinase XerD